MSKSKIEWTDMTWNPVWGCNGGCEYCYARGIAKRFAEQMAIKELKYNDEDERFGNYEVQSKAHEIADFDTPTYLESQSFPQFPNKSKRIFVGSMSDIAFWIPNWITDAVYIFKSYPQHIFQILTKFPKILQERLIAFGIKFPKNVWLGITAENQEQLGKRYFYLKDIPAGKHFISFEPLQGKINLNLVPQYNPENMCISYYQITSDAGTRKAVDWIIVGGQTGAKAMPLKHGWVKSIQKQCEEANIPFFFKSWGEWVCETHEVMKTFPILDFYGKNDDKKRGIFDDNGTWRVGEGQWSRYENLGNFMYYRVGKKLSGNEIDSKKYMNFPV